MNGSAQTPRFRFWLWLIRVIGVLVPCRLRADWRQEWEAELRYREMLLEEWGPARLAPQARLAAAQHQRVLGCALATATTMGGRIDSRFAFWRANADEKSWLYFRGRGDADGDPNIVGKAIRLQSEPFTVVGVTAREFIGTTPDTPVRAAGDAQRAMAAVRGEAEALDPRLRTVVQRTADHLAEHLTLFRALALIAGVLGALALLLASIGLYGVMSFVVTQRTREIGIRVALGAQGEDVVWLFLKEGLRLIVIGLAVGLAGSTGISRLLAAVLVDLNPLDPAGVRRRLHLSCAGGAAGDLPAGTPGDEG